MDEAGDRQAGDGATAARRNGARAQEVALLLALLGGCEKEGEGRFTPPHVGQQQDVTTAGDFQIDLPDGTSKRGSYRTVLHTKALEVDKLAITRMRVTIVHDMYRFEDELRPLRNGIYELTTKGGYTVKKEGAAELTESEREYFKDWGPTLDRRGIRNVLGRTLREGVRFTPTAEETDSLGFPRSRNLVMTPTKVERDTVTFAIAYDADMDQELVVAHARGTIVFGAHSTEADQTADVTYDGRHVGTMHWYDVRTND